MMKEPIINVHANLVTVVMGQLLGGVVIGIEGHHRGLRSTPAATKRHTVADRVEVGPPITDALQIRIDCQYGKSIIIISTIP